MLSLQAAAAPNIFSLPARVAASCIFQSAAEPRIIHNSEIVRHSEEHSDEESVWSAYRCLTALRLSFSSLLSRVRKWTLRSLRSSIRFAQQDVAASMPQTTAFAGQERNQTLEEGLILHSELFCSSPPHSFQRLLFAPAAGVRKRETGVLSSVGTEGDGWSSSSFGGAYPHNAGYLQLVANRVYPQNNASRSYALTVRCVQHLLWSCFFVHAGFQDGFL